MEETLQSAPIPTEGGTRKTLRPRNPITPNYADGRLPVEVASSGICSLPPLPFSPHHLNEHCIGLYPYKAPKVDPIYQAEVPDIKELRYFIYYLGLCYTSSPISFLLTDPCLNHSINENQMTRNR
jgi:hypothetical protein